MCLSTSVTNVNFFYTVLRALPEVFLSHWCRCNCMSIQIDPIVLANVVAGPKPIDPMNEGANKSFIGYVDAADGARHRAFIKDLSRKQLCNELLAAALGRSLGLPMPRPFLAVVDPEDLDNTFSLEYAPTLGVSSYRLVFASEDAVSPSLSQVFIGEELEIIIDKLREWPSFWRSLVFDEWIANIDRHPGNYLLLSAGDISLIDHDQCFTGPFWTLPALDPVSPQKNRMLQEHLQDGLSNDDRDQIVNESYYFSERAGAISAESAVGACHLRRQEFGIIYPEEVDAICNFIARRASLVGAFVSEKVGRRVLI